MTTTEGGVPAVDPLVADAIAANASREERAAQRERLRLLLRSKVFIAGAAVVLIWVICAIFGKAIAPDDPSPPTRSPT